MFTCRCQIALALQRGAALSRVQLGAAFIVNFGRLQILRGTRVYELPELFDSLRSARVSIKPHCSIDGGVRLLIALINPQKYVFSDGTI